MRILQINSAKNFGGGERHLIGLCAGLSARGDEVFVALRAQNNWREKLSFLPRENIVDFPLRNSLDFLSTRRIAKFIKEKNIEIVHAHLARDYPIAALAARASKAKLVLTRHLLFPLNFSHKIVLPKDAAFIAVSESVRRALIKQNILPPEQIWRIYNGVNLRRFTDEAKSANKKDLLRRLNLPVESMLVGIVGEIAAHKGQIDFARAAALVLKQHPNAEFLIVGRDASMRKNHENDLRSLIEELDLPNKMHLLGWLEDVAPFLSALDVFVSASHFESFGLATVEAMAAGCAVVSTETDGSLETIENGKTGKLVPIANPALLAEAIIKLLNDMETRRILSANASNAAAENFSIERMVLETEKLYRAFAEPRIK